jgi:DnaJ family protein C protein 2
MVKISPEELATLAAKLTAAGTDGAAVKAAYVEEAKRLIGEGKLKEAEIKALN